MHGLFVRLNVSTVCNSPRTLFKCHPTLDEALEAPVLFCPFVAWLKPAVIIH